MTNTFVSMNNRGRYDGGQAMLIIGVPYEEDGYWKDEVEGEMPGAASVAARFGANVVAFTYAVGDYEGTGDALFRVNDVWYHWSLSHCSCYGPWDGVGSDLCAEPLTLDKLDLVSTDEIFERWPDHASLLVSHGVLNNR